MRSLALGWNNMSAAAAAAYCNTNPSHDLRLIVS
jgi:hypothetical protein